MLVNGVESFKDWTVHIQNAIDGITLNHRNDYFGVRGLIASDMARKFVNVRNDNCFFPCYDGTTNPFTNWNTNTSRFALEGAKHKLSVLKEIKPDPINMIHELIKKC